ncbi:META domain-containing protein [Aquimarina litoralis]|uniref:META domain-containing protein n=1 Tax=Aquimarina litoralis TaxID=584605 RepID=UPI001C584CAF|nr:META domain-containing protein [Aquimarina litoralis]MBW1295340.1 META domain-containing protein [Aquimarina litoralis]
MKQVGLLLCCLFLFANCNSTKNTNSENNINKNQSEPKGTYDVITLYGENVSEHKLTIIIDPENKTMSGFSGCNTYTCDYTVKEKVYSAGFPMATKRYCEKSGNVEKQFFKALSELQTCNTDNKSLVFNDANKKEIITAKEQ